MKKTMMMLAALLLTLACAAGQAQDYYTLSEVREQAACGWHKTYTDRYGREIAVDVDVQVFGEDIAPVLEAKPAQYRVNGDALPEGATWRDDSGVSIELNNPANFVFQCKSGEKPLIIRHTYGEKVDMDRVYMPEYGAALTMRDMVENLSGVLEAQGIPADCYVYDQPMDFSVRCKVKKSSGEVVEPAIYLAHFWQEMHGLPILEHAARAYQNVSWPDFCPQVMFGMRARDEYSIAVQAMEGAEVLAQDIPLCAFDTVRASVEALIKAGYVRNVLDVRLGLAVYNTPDIPESTKSYYDVACYYLVPTWVVGCVYMDSPKQEYELKDPHDDELTPDVRTQAGFATLIINAQTGQLLDRNDKSKDGRGDADYKGFISWEDVR